MRLYRASALAFAVAFAAVGIVFLLAPGAVWLPFERLARPVGIPGVPAAGGSGGLFRALAAAYMYGVALLAWMMFRRPGERVWPALLAHLKLASAAASFVLLVLDGFYLVYLANGLVDGVIGAAVLLLRRRVCVARAGVEEALR
jgi:hypothetical protein